MMVYYDYLKNYLDDDHSNHPQFPGGLALVQAAERGSVEELQRLLPGANPNLLAAELRLYQGRPGSGLVMATSWKISWDNWGKVGEIMGNMEYIMGKMMGHDIGNILENHWENH